MSHFSTTCAVQFVSAKTHSCSSRNHRNRRIRRYRIAAAADAALLQPGHCCMDNSCSYMGVLWHQRHTPMAHQHYQMSVVTVGMLYIWQI
jgi:hypothetical protein